MNEMPFTGLDGRSNWQPNGSDSKRRYAFLPAGKSKAFRCCCLDGYAVNRNVGDLGDALSDCVTVRSELWSFADNGGVDMGNGSTAGAYLRHRGGKKDSGGSAAPLRVSWRKMASYVAFGQGSEQGVGDRMTEDI